MRTAFEVLAVLVAVLVLLTLLAHLLVWRVTAASPPTGQWMDIEGERLHYRSLGQGPALVLVHGLGGESRNFDYLPLEQLAQRWRLILVDRPGAGYSPRRDDAHAGLAEQARILAGFIRALRLPQPPLLVGHSLGGAIALRLALQDPGCIAGLALIAWAVATAEAQACAVMGGALYALGYAEARWKRFETEDEDAPEAAPAP